MAKQHQANAEETPLGGGVHGKPRDRHRRVSGQRASSVAAKTGGNGFINVLESRMDRTVSVDQIVAWRGHARSTWRWLDGAGSCETGEPWQDSWVPRGNLTKDLRGGGIDSREAQAMCLGGRGREVAMAGEAPGRAW